MSLLGPLLHDPRIFEIVSHVGVRYWSGRGTPSTPWSKVKDGIDCSGWIQCCWVFLAIYSSSEPDRRATADIGHIQSLANICLPTPQPQLGDIAIYPGHVALCIGGEWTVGASGGTSTTLGDDPRACVKLERFDYRKDFLAFGTLKPEHRVP